MSDVDISGSDDSVHAGLDLDNPATARRIDNSGFAYMVFLQVSAKAGQNLMPISASVTYRLQ